MNLYNLYNIEFKFYGNNKKGELEVYLKTDIGKMSVFKSINKQTKKEYLKLDEMSAKKIKFQFEREVDDLELDIVAIVLRTSDVNIPSTKYTLQTLDELVKQQDLEERKENDIDEGIAYIIVDNNTACTLYDNFYVFGKDSGGLIKSLEKELEQENEELRHNNLKMILDYYYNLEKGKGLQ